MMIQPSLYDSRADRQLLKKSSNRQRVLAVASSGGHWAQLRLLRSSWKGCDVVYVTTFSGYLREFDADEIKESGAPRIMVVTDANRSKWLHLARQVVEIAVVLLRVRPDVIVTTGATPGYFAIRLGRLLGIKTIWIDSIANSDELSLSGRAIGKYCDVWLTQWEHLARPEGPQFYGSVL